RSWTVKADTRGGGRLAKILLARWPEQRDESTCAKRAQRYGHDGRSNTSHEVILRNGGEAQFARDNYASLSRSDQRDLLDFLGSLVLFPSDDTASNLDSGDRSAVGFPQAGHGFKSIKLTKLFNDPTVIE